LLEVINKRRSENAKSDPSSWPVNCTIQFAYLKIDASVETAMLPFDYSEFSLRWLKARISAASMGENSQPQNVKMTHESQQLEVELVNEIPLNMLDFALKQVFDNSRRLAMSASQHHRIRLELQDFQELLISSSLPCAVGQWTQRSQSRYVTRTGCVHGQSKNTRICDWYREAIDGVVVGLGETERYVRHRSEAYGDEGCLDIVFDDEQNLPNDELRYGPIPPPLEQHLNSVVSNWGLRGLKLDWKGYSAGTLFYTLAGQDPTDTLCQSRGRNLHQELQKSVRDVFPTLRIQDSTPLAVYAEGTR
jgi:hypothetical protein